MVFLDKLVTKKLITNVKRGWDPDKHLTVFALQLKEEPLKLHNNNSSQDRTVPATYLSTAPEGRGAVVDSLKVLMASPAAAGNTSLHLTACHVFLAANMLREALQCVHLGLTMEHLALCVQIYLKIDRFDLAHDALNLLKQADEDSILAQLTGAYLAIAQGRSQSADAVHTLAGLSEQYGPSLMLLNCTAVANMVGARYEAAEGNLKAAVAECGGGSDADTLVNLVACSQHLGRKGGVVERYVAALKAGCADHPFVEGLAQVEGAFEREATKYMSVLALEL